MSRGLIPLLALGAASAAALASAALAPAPPDRTVAMVEMKAADC
ncbi:MAG: hypothetical protein AB7R89_01590 [Dehalococcoidia bacterium]